MTKWIQFIKPCKWSK